MFSRIKNLSKTKESASAKANNANDMPPNRRWPGCFNGRDSDLQLQIKAMKVLDEPGLVISGQLLLPLGGRLRETEHKAS